MMFNCNLKILIIGLIIVFIIFLISISVLYHYNYCYDFENKKIFLIRHQGNFRFNLFSNPTTGYTGIIP